MNLNHLRSLIFLIITTLSMSFASIAKADLVQWAGNGHFYEAIATTSEISWDDAQADAVSKGGYLVTLTSAPENAFVFDLIDDSEYWYANSPPFEYQYVGPWIGAFQPDGSAEPLDGWEWVNGDGTLGSTFSNWLSGEPNDFGGVENRASYFSNTANTTSSAWNDTSGNSRFSYVIEYNMNPVPEPASGMFILCGLSAIVVRRKRSRV